MANGKVLLKTDCANLDWEQILELFRLVNWPERDLETVKRSFEKSTYKCFFTEGDQIIAFGRTVDDDCYYGLIVDVLVHPNYQGKGLGTEVVNYLKSRMVGFKFITLTSAPGKDKFYDKIGWRRQRSAFLWPVSEKQIVEHCFPDNNLPL